MEFSRNLVAFVLVATLGSVRADLIPVHLDARCPDQALQYSIDKHAQATVKASNTHKLVADHTALVRIMLSAAPVRHKNSEDDPPLGISLAVLVRKKASNGTWDVTAFQNAFVPLDEIETTIKSSVSAALR